MANIIITPALSAEEKLALMREDAAHDICDNEPNAYGIGEAPKIKSNKTPHNYSYSLQHSRSCTVGSRNSISPCQATTQYMAFPLTKNKNKNAMRTIVKFIICMAFLGL